ncbi:MAG: D-aminoacylase [Gemmatimonadota bacterium]|nr:D-aminoacylase [Gemmatimonadota bacterium]
MKRRDFVAGGTKCALAGLAGLTGLGARPVAPSVAGTGPRTDLVIRGGTLVDGTGTSPRAGDVAVVGDRIAAVGRVSVAGATEIDARDMAVAPGFVDIHSHADLSLLVNPRAESCVRQGVTLAVVGQDGSSIGPWGDGAFESARDRYRRSYGVEIDFRDIGGFLDRIDRVHPAVSVASMVGHGTVRNYVIGGADRPATETELERMRALVRDGLAAGAVGLSTGLEYTPGSFATRDELVALAAELRGTPYPYATHMRNEDDRLLAALEEALHVGRAAGVAVQVSHLKAQGERNHWKAVAALAAIEAARAHGVDAHFDRYPYAAYATGLSNLFPASARAGGAERFLARLADPEAGPALERACRDKIALLGSWDVVRITRIGGPNAWARGRRLGELAAERGEDPYALTVRLLREAGGSVGMIGFGMSEENTERVLAHPLGMVCSDGGAYAPYGPLSDSSPHPRGYGTFPRLLGRYVRERKAMSLEAAVHKVSGLPARKLGLADRGVLRAGAVADVVVFDPGGVADRATFEDPHRYPAGIPHVVVRGVLTIRDGERTGRTGGRAVRGGGVGRQA